MTIDARRSRAPLASALLVLSVACTSAEPEPASLTLVIAEMALPSPDVMGRADGIDLDGVDSAGSATGSCVDRPPDYTSPRDPSEQGVDNMVATLAQAASMTLDPPPTSPSANDAIAEGRYLLAITISDIDSFDEDPEVVVEAVRVQLEGCVAESLASCRPVLVGGRVAPDQSFTAIGTPFVGSGAIVGGALRAQFDRIDLPIVAVAPSAEAFDDDLVARNVQLEGVLEGDALVSAAFGARLVVDDLVTAYTLSDPGSMPEDLRRTLEQYADMDPQSPGAEICSALSVGLRVSAVAASLR